MTAVATASRERRGAGHVTLASSGFNKGAYAPHKGERQVANNVILMGRLGAKPELRRVGGENTPVVDVSIATNRFSRGKKATDWHNVTLWDKQAELICTQDKGDQVYVEGRLQTDEWEDKEGNKRRKVYVQAFRFEFCGPKRNGGPQTGAVGPSSNPYGDDDLNL